MYVGSIYFREGKSYSVGPDNIYTHENYAEYPTFNDIALIRIPKLTFSGKNNLMEVIFINFV